MPHTRNSAGYSPWIMHGICAAMIVGCGGSGSSPIPGADAALRPTVTAVVPLNDATGVSTATTVTATFSTPMSPLTGAASFVVTCLTPCVNPTGTVALDVTKTIATFTLTPSTKLQPSTLYTATVTDAMAISNGLAIAAPSVWRFTTSIPGDITRPRVTLTVPGTTSPGPTPGNTAIIALFSKAMAPATIIQANFTVTCAAPPAPQATPCVDPTGSVSYDAANRTAIFTPDAPLTTGDTYTAAIAAAATDLAGNALQGNQLPPAATGDYEWSFTARNPTAQNNVAVESIHPTVGQKADVCPSASVNATFSVPPGLRLDPRTVNATTFTVTGPAPAMTPVVAASVLLDADTGIIAIFTPQAPFTAGVTYRAKILVGAAGVKDLAVPANTIEDDFAWSFTAGPATASCLPSPVSLGSAARYGDFGGSPGMTNTGTLTVINGDIGSIDTVTGFHDTAGDTYTETPANVGDVNGTIFTCINSTTGPNHAAPNAPNCQAATQARFDAQTAYFALAALPPVGTPIAQNLAGLTVSPGVYVAQLNSFLIQGNSDLTLDAGGDANAVWVFQMDKTLTVGGPGKEAPRSIILKGGAQAKNVYWQVGSAAIINAGGGGTMVGTIISQAGAAFSTVGSTNVTTLNGRALSIAASVTLVNTVINVPAP